MHALPFRKTSGTGIKIIFLIEEKENNHERAGNQRKIKELLIDSLGIEAEVLTDDVPLFGDGIGLDSIDSLEMIAAIDKEFGVSMTGVGKEPFYNVASLAKYVAEHK